MNPDELFAAPQREVARSLTDGRPSALVAASSGVDINAPGRSGASPLLSAKWCACGREPEHAAVISGLARAGVDPFLATSLDVGRALCAEPSEPLAAPLDARDVLLRSAIFWALCQLEIDAVDDLLGHGTNPRAIDLTGLSFGNVLQDLLRDAEPGITAHRPRLLRDRVVAMGLSWPPASPGVERACKGSAGVAPIEPREAPSTAATLCVMP